MMMPSPTEEAEYAQIIRNFRIALAVSAIVLAIGSTFYHLVEKFSWLDSVYLGVITLATVGYGDITPRTSAGKVFTIFYILVGIGIFATLVNLFVKRAVVRRKHK